MDLQVQITMKRLELCRLLCVSPSAFDGMRRSRAFPVLPIDWGGRPRWIRGEVAKWLGGDETMPDEDFALLTVTEIAALLGVHRTTAYRRLPNSSLSGFAVHLGGERRYPRRAVARALTGVTFLDASQWPRQPVDDLRGLGARGGRSAGSS